MKPYLSIIVSSRNDNHGGDMDKRQRIFIRGLIDQANRYKLHIELIVVEWNPPQEKPYLHEILPQPKEGDFLSLRYIVVPTEIHTQYRFAHTMPLYQMIAKNVGIRRAAADFILCSNVDLLFSNELMEILAAKNLDKKCFYRANRSDIPEQIDETLDTQQQLALARTRIMRQLGRDPDYLYLLNWPGWIYFFSTVAKTLNYLMSRLRKATMKPVDLLMMNLDTNACGDFTLMHKDAWMDIQGYPELDLYSIHIDSMGVIAATARGYQQHLFPTEACTFHIDHYNGWESLSAIEKISFINNRPGIGWDIVNEAGKKLIEEKLRYDFNKPDWGFANHQFREFVFNPF